MMSKISQLAGLSSTYTNHSLRATSAMFASGVPEQIVAGHRNLTALRQYERTTEGQYTIVGESISHMEQFTETMQENKAAVLIKNEVASQAPVQKATVEEFKNYVGGNLKSCSITFNINNV